MPTCVQSTTSWKSPHAVPQLVMLLSITSTSQSKHLPNPLNNCPVHSCYALCFRSLMTRGQIACSCDASAVSINYTGSRSFHAFAYPYCPALKCTRAVHTEGIAQILVRTTV